MPPSYSVTSQPNVKTLCYYTNSTHKIQLIRVADGGNQSLEKIVFPQQRVLFEAIAQEQLTVYSESKGKQVLAEIIPCQNLQTQTTET